MNVAHDLGNVDPVTNVPLAARVCYGVAGLPFSFQVDKFNDIVNYQDGNTGPLLSALCAFMWFTKARHCCRRYRVGRCSCPIDAQVVEEMAACLTTLRAVARLHGKTTRFVDGVVVSVGTTRLVCFFAVQSVRLTVASMLCYGGSYFIAHTIGLGDLILNCIALEVRRSAAPDRDRGRAAAAPVPCLSRPD